MPITVADFYANEGLLDTLNPPAEQCTGCGVKIQETVTGRHEVEGGVYCSDDFFGALGTEIEAHPISSGAVRRG